METTHHHWNPAATVLAGDLIGAPSGVGFHAHRHQIRRLVKRNQFQAIIIELPLHAGRGQGSDHRRRERFHLPRANIPPRLLTATDARVHDRQAKRTRARRLAQPPRCLLLPDHVNVTVSEDGVGRSGETDRRRRNQRVARVKPVQVVRVMSVADIRHQSERPPGGPTPNPPSNVAIGIGQLPGPLRSLLEFCHRHAGRLKHHVLSVV